MPSHFYILAIRLSCEWKAFIGTQLPESRVWQWKDKVVAFAFTIISLGGLRFILLTICPQNLSLAQTPIRLQTQTQSAK